jgi:hypothetical protein
MEMRSSFIREATYNHRRALASSPDARPLQAWVVEYTTAAVYCHSPQRCTLPIDTLTRENVTLRVIRRGKSRMYVAYFDEVKPSSDNGNQYLVGGIIVAMDDIAAIEEQMTSLSQKVFGSRELSIGTEFHAKFLYHRKGAFKHMEVEDRLSVFRELANILSDRERIKQVLVRINTEQLFGNQEAAEIAFMHYVERVERAIGKNGLALLIGDLDDEQAKKMVADFLRYRITGTHSQYGRLITRIVDTVHFCRSHHSRMIQLADAYLYMMARQGRPTTNWMAEEFAKILKEANLFPNSYKTWPN